MSSLPCPLLSRLRKFSHGTEDLPAVSFNVEGKLGLSLLLRAALAEMAKRAADETERGGRVIVKIPEVQACIARDEDPKSVAEFHDRVAAEVKHRLALGYDAARRAHADRAEGAEDPEATTNEDEDEGPPTKRRRGAAGGGGGYVKPQRGAAQREGACVSIAAVNEVVRHAIGDRPQRVSEVAVFALVAFANVFVQSLMDQLRAVLAARKKKQVNLSVLREAAHGLEPVARILARLDVLVPTEEEIAQARARVERARETAAAAAAAAAGAEDPKSSA